MKVLTQHLDEVNESYFEHMRIALSFTGHMLVGALACAIHAFFPFLFETTGSQKIKDLYDRMLVSRKSKNGVDNATVFKGKNQTIETLATQTSD